MPKISITRSLFNKKDNVIQVVNSKPRLLKIRDNTNSIENYFSLNLRAYYVKYVEIALNVSPTNPKDS
jgi:hypothetical protein